jgi:DNA-binding ferritin-like protein (Dps family)
MNKETKILLKENNKFEEKNLSKDSQKAMTDIVVYLRGSKISEFNQEKVRKDINYMVYEGEQRGEKIEEIIGIDYKVFCDEIISAVPKMTRGEIIKENILISAYAMGIFLLIVLAQKIIMNIIEDKSLMYIRLSVGEIIGGVLICIESFALFWFIKSTVFMKIKRAGLVLWAACTLMFSVPMLLFMFLRKPDFEVFVPIFVLFVVICILSESIVNLLFRERG